LSFTNEQFPSLHRFSLEQYHELGELGLLDRRTEYWMASSSTWNLSPPWHANIGDILFRIFNESACGRFRVRVQYPINLGQMSQHQRDLVLYRPGMWRGQHPGAADISLVIEISDSSLIFDLGQNLRSTRVQESRNIGRRLESNAGTSFCGTAFQEPNVPGQH
jgi:hypothetical protein